MYERVAHFERLYELSSIIIIVNKINIKCWILLLFLLGRAESTKLRFFVTIALVIFLLIFHTYNNMLFVRYTNKEINV